MKTITRTAAESEDIFPNAEVEASFPLWSAFEELIGEAGQQRVDNLVEELRVYDNELPIHRLSDPITWWKLNKPRLDNLVDELRVYNNELQIHFFF